MNSKRKRLPNFTHGEEIILRTLTLKYQKEIDEVSTSRSWKVKSSIWNQIATDFFSKTSIPRPGAKLKAKYDAMKKNEPPRPAPIKEESNETLENFLVPDASSTLKVETPKQDQEIVVPVQEVIKSPAKSLSPNREDFDETVPPADQNNNVQHETIRVIPTQSLKTTQTLDSDLAQNVSTELETPQMVYYRNQDMRAQQKHGLELKNLAIQQVLLETELKIKQAELRRFPEEEQELIDDIVRKPNTTGMDPELAMQVDSIIESSKIPFDIAAKINQNNEINENNQNDNENNDVSVDSD